MKFRGLIGGLGLLIRVKSHCGCVFLPVLSFAENLKHKEVS